MVDQPWLKVLLATIAVVSWARRSRDHVNIWSLDY